MATRIGVDVGGTFTDLIFYDDQAGSVRVAKAPTTPDALERGVMHAVAEALSNEDVARAEYFMHGATIGLNALLQRSGAVTALLCTEGFRDSLEIRRADRDVMYDMHWRQPAPLVPRRLRLPIGGRIGGDGGVIRPLSADDVREATKKLVAAGVESVGVCFMNAYVNPAHEVEAERLLREHGFEGDVSLSHRLSREYREYERTSTTVVDAYIRGATSHYLDRLEDELHKSSFGGEVLVMRSGGGVLAAEELADRPFEAIQSGPVAGAAGAADLCRTHGWELAIAADVGGTSFDTTLIAGGRPDLRHEGSIAGWPLLTPWVDVRSIGAGGGSIAYSDGGLLRVGPRSAGAVPGPACYGEGGTEPTVTDAASLLGMLGDGVFASGLALDRDLADGAFAALSEELAMSAEDLARGVITIATSAMADTIREITIGQGEDPRRARLLAFGGAGPLFASLLSTELEIRDVVIPQHAGNFSAWGLIGQDRTYEAGRTVIRRWSDETLAEICQHVEAMLADIATRRVDLPGGEQHDLETIATFDLRYLGQDHTIPVSLGVDGTLPSSAIEDASARFREDYRRRFGMTMELPLEAVTVRVTVRELLPRASRVASSRAPAGGGTDAADSSCRGYSFTQQDWLDFTVVDRARLETGASIAGPAIALEHTATTYVDAGFTALVHDGDLLHLINHGVEG